MSSKEIYVVVAEHKLEGPLVYEACANKSTYDNAHQRMKQLAARPDIIRAALGRIVFVEGNESLIPKEEADESASR